MNPLSHYDLSTLAQSINSYRIVARPGRRPNEARDHHLGKTSCLILHSFGPEIRDASCAPPDLFIIGAVVQTAGMDGTHMLNVRVGNWNAAISSSHSASKLVQRSPL
jgi:hypothetical protein